MVMCHFGKSLCIFYNANATVEFDIIKEMDWNLPGKMIQLFFSLWNSTEYTA